MSRSTRLLRLLQAMRGRRQPVTAAQLAEALEVSGTNYTSLTRIIRNSVGFMIWKSVGDLIGEGVPVPGQAAVAQEFSIALLKSLKEL